MNKCESCGRNLTTHYDQLNIKNRTISVKTEPLGTYFKKQKLDSCCRIQLTSMIPSENLAKIEGINSK